MKLSNILSGITKAELLDIEINNITLDSRQAKKGTLFCAIKGHSVDARKFIPNTIENEVSAILADNDEQQDYVEIVKNTPIIYIKNLNSKLSKIADNFYQSPSQKANIIGITGTNGKTTISQLVCQWIDLIGFKAATMGTIGNGFYGKLQEAKNTTGSALDIQENIANFVKQGANTVTMEVSSHGLVQNRVDNVNFDTAIFTNLTQDHLDYHKTMEEYFTAKSVLFTKFNTKANILNLDDDYSLKLADLIKDKKSIIAICTENENLAKSFKNYVYAQNIEYSQEGLNISVQSSYGNFVISTKLIGKFNVLNILQAFATMVSLGFNTEDIIAAATKLNPVVGRMEVFNNKKQATIIVDYAHTPDALEKALQASRKHTKNKLWCIFGCGGDRDTTKRPLMAKSAESLADKIIITNDNPRTEDANNIIEDIFEGLNNKDDVIILQDRFEATKYALDNSSKDDIILIAGKGHEDYQIIGDKTVHYSDRETACQLLNITMKV